MPALDDALLALRPSLDLPPAATAAERFQNDTLRPVVKLQHRRLLGAWHRYAQRQKGRFYRLNRPEQREYLRHALQTNRDLRAFLLGTLCGVLTEVEWAAFRQNESELARRAMTLTLERLLSTEDTYQPPPTT